MREIPSGPYYPYFLFVGYSDLGPPQIPPLAAYIGMTDRSTGAVYYLAFDPCQEGRLVLIPKAEIPFSISFVTRVYEPYDGPFIGNNQLRLGINNAHLVFDTLNRNSQQNPKAFDLAGNKSLWLEIFGVAYGNIDPYAPFPDSIYPTILTDDDGNVLTDDFEQNILTPP